MPSWGEILNEVLSLGGESSVQVYQSVLHKYQARLSRHTKRDTILYATDWTRFNHPASAISITEDDLCGFMSVIHGLKTKELDLILHTPGGSPEAAEAMVSYMHEKFEDIRVIIPHAAMSAGTLIACASSRLVMGRHSSLGPTDPQLSLTGKYATHTIPAQDIIGAFERAQWVAENHPGRLQAWVPMLEQYPPGLVERCLNAQKLSEDLAQECLATYMFNGESNAKQKAEKIAKTLSSSAEFKSHSRHISRKKCKEMGLKVIDLEDDQEFQDLVLSVFHATNILFQLVDVTKIIRNQNGSTIVKIHRPTK